MAEQTLNIPQIIVFVVVAFLAARWFLSKPSSNGTRSGPIRSAVAARVNPAHIDQIAQMFPQLDRRSIAWELQKSGGNVTAVTEKVLNLGTLETPPNSFQIPPSRSPTPSRTPVTPAKPTQPDLITRYNLASKIGKEAAPAAEEQTRSKAWSQDRVVRQSNLQRRREEMILAARRKMEEQGEAKA